MLLKRLERARYGELLADQQRLLREAFHAHNGEEIDTQGDSFFVAFRSASDAVASAVAIQTSLADHEWPDRVEVRVRIGIHTGEAAAAGERYVGFSVHRAARVGGAAHGGQVLLSDSTRSLVEDDLPHGVFLRDLGLYRLKDVDRPERISQVAAEGLQSKFPSLRGAEPVKAQQILRRRSLLAATLAGVIAAAVAIPVFALGQGSSGSSASASVGANAVGAIDASSGRLVASIPVGTSPSSVTAGRGSLWVVNVSDNSVSRIDSKTNAGVQTIAVGNSPAGIAFGVGFVWVANSFGGTVSKIDPNANGGSGGVVDTIPVGNGPEGVAFGAGHLWVTNSTDRTVMEFVPGSHTPQRTIGVVAGADAIAFGFGFVWVVSGGGNSVTRIAARSGTVLPPIDLGNGPSAIAVGAGAVWVANSLDGTVSRIDARTGAVKVIPVGEGLSGIAADNAIVWVSNERAGTLSRIDPVAEKVVQTVTTGNRPEGVALAEGKTYVAVRTSGLAQRGGTLTVLSHDPLGPLDPAVTYGVQSWEAIILTNDGLVAFKRVGGSDGATLVPDLATSIPAPTDGGRAYTFQVRPGIHYSTGGLVQPADFRRAIERSLAIWAEGPPGNQLGTGFYFKGIVGAGACLKAPKRCDLSKGIVVDPASNTVTFHLTAPDPDFLDKLAISSAYALPAATPLKARLPLPATGPYMIKSYSHDSLRLVRNPRFHEWAPAAQPAGYPDEIVWKVGVSPGAQIDAVKAGKADYAVDAGGETALSSLRRDGYGTQLHLNPTLDTLYFFLNTRLAPFNNVTARKAVSYAVDRNRLAEPLRHVFPVQLTCQVLPPNFAGYHRYCPYTLDLAKARKLVAASGTRGEAVTVSTSATFAPIRAAAAYFASVLQSLGYKARLKPIKGDKYYATVGDSRQRVQAGGAGWSADYPSSSDFFYPNFTCASFQPASSTGNDNFAEFCNPKIDAEIARARALQPSDPQAAAALWSRIDHDVINQVPWVPYSTDLKVDFVSRRVGNFQYNPQWGVLLDQMWVK